LANLNDLAEKLGCSDDSVYRALHAGRITATRVGRNWRISPAEVMQVLKDGL